MKVRRRGSERQVGAKVNETRVQEYSSYRGGILCDEKSRLQRLRYGLEKQGQKIKKNKLSVAIKS